MGETAPLDVAVLALVGLAGLRGLWIGAIREAFSLGALVAACLAARFYSAPLGEWLQVNGPFELEELTARIVAGALLVGGVIAAVAALGGVLRRGVRAAGLGLADRLAGGLLGMTEGALVAAILVAGALFALGADHPTLSETRSVAMLDAIRSGAPDPANVAAPPPEGR